MLIGICGRMRVGKDVASSHLVEKHAFNRVAFADPLKWLALHVNPIVDYLTIGDGTVVPWRLADVIEMCGAEEAKAMAEVRALYQNLGTGIRELCDEFWVDVAEAKIRTLWETSRHVVVTDVRFPNEADRIVSLGGTILRIIRDGSGEGITNSEHISETALNDWYRSNDHIEIYNIETLEYLYDQLDEIVRYHA